MNGADEHKVIIKEPNESSKDLRHELGTMEALSAFKD
jgi:hypothetical protein